MSVIIECNTRNKKKPATLQLLTSCHNLTRIESLVGHRDKSTVSSQHQRSSARTKEPRSTRRLDCIYNIRGAILHPISRTYLYSNWILQKHLVAYTRRRTNGTRSSSVSARMALSLTQQYCTDLSNFGDPLRVLQSFDTFLPTDQMEFTVTALDEVKYLISVYL